MRLPHLPDTQLTERDVPAVDAPLDQLIAFGHRHHAYKVAGSLPQVAEIALDVHDDWVTGHDAAPDAVLALPLARLRIALFHTVRALDQGDGDGGASRDGGPSVDDDVETWIRVLVASVHAAVGAHDQG